MSASPRQPIAIWLILLVVLAAAYWIGQRIYDVPQGAAGAAGAEAGPPGMDLPEFAQPSGFEIRDPDAILREGPRRNPFEYAPEPAPEPVLTDGAASIAPFAAAPAAPPPSAQPAPPRPPPPPPVPFRYSGYSTIGGEGELRAWLFDDGEPFGVVEGEVLMGRYRVIAVTTDYVEVEDMEYLRRERLPLLFESP